jgi:ABC-type transport system involved in cytochrome bd biosynthesis fused ATPase/permease subunit
LSTIKNAHKIIVLDQGEIAETGTHEELVQKNGLYRRIYETQLATQAKPETQTQPTTNSKQKKANPPGGTD